MNVLIVNKPFIKRGINLMWLIWVHGPAVLELVLFVFHLLPGVFLDHELSGDFVPAFLPVNSGIQDQNCHIINPGVHSDESEPAVFHGSEFVIVYYETVIVKFVFIHGALEVEFDGIFRAEFVDGDYALFSFLHFDLTRDVAFEGWDEKAVRAFLNLGNFDIFGPCKIFPLLCVFDVKFLRNVTDGSRVWLLLRATVVIFAVLEVDVLESLLGVELEGEVRVVVFDYAFVIGEDHGWRSEEMGLISNFIDKSRGWKPSFLEVECPVFASMRYLFDHRIQKNTNGYEYQYQYEYEYKV